MKKILAAILALTMATAAFASCGSSDDSSSKAETTSSAATESKADDAVSKSEDGKEKKPTPVSEIPGTLENQETASLKFTQDMNIADFVEAIDDGAGDTAKLDIKMEELEGIPMVKVTPLDKDRRDAYKTIKFHFMMDKLFAGHEDQLANIFSIEVELISKAGNKVKDDEGNEKLVNAYFAGRIATQPYSETEKTNTWNELDEFSGDDWINEWTYKKLTITPGISPAYSFTNTKEPQYLAITMWGGGKNQPNHWNDLYISNITFKDSDGNAIECPFGK